MTPDELQEYQRGKEDSIAQIEMLASWATVLAAGYGAWQLAEWIDADIAWYKWASIVAIAYVAIVPLVLGLCKIAKNADDRIRKER